MQEFVAKKAKTLITDVNVSFLGLLGAIEPTAGTIAKVGAELVKGLYGGLWVDGTATVNQAGLTFDGNRSNRAVFGRHIQFSIAFNDMIDVTVEKALTGGLLPSSRSITISTKHGEVKLATPWGGGDKLGSALQAGVE